MLGPCYLHNKIAFPFACLWAIWWLPYTGGYANPQQDLCLILPCCFLPCVIPTASWVPLAGFCISPVLRISEQIEQMGTGLPAHILYLQLMLDIKGKCVSDAVLNLLLSWKLTQLWSPWDSPQGRLHLFCHCVPLFWASAERLRAW